MISAGLNESTRPNLEDIVEVLLSELELIHLPFPEFYIVIGFRALAQ